MITFTAIEVENIFAYGALSRIDLTGCAPDQNIILVAGHNGAGKTSLLNAIKLLFLGPADEGLRRVGFGRAPINVKHYVTGQTGRWYGVFNTGGRASGAPARVALEWRSGEETFKAQRVFRLAPTPLGFAEELTVTVDGFPLQAAEAEATLLQLLPREVVPFFFFDGEQIQSIADAEIGREQGEIERLLGLAFIAPLTRELDNYGKIKRRSGMPEDVRVKLVQAENAQREAAAAAEAAGRARVAGEDEMLDLERQKRKLDVERNRLRTGISEADRRRMVGRIAVLASQRETLASEIVDQLPSESPWLTNPELVRSAFQAVDQQVQGGADASLADRLHHIFPEEIVRRLARLAPPVHLDKAQHATLLTEIADALEDIGVSPSIAHNPLLASLSPRQVRKLRDQFLVWTERGAALAATHADKLRLMRQLTNDEQQAQRELDEAELSTEEARQKFETLTADLAAVEAELRERSTRVAESRIEEQRAQRAAAAAMDEIRRFETEFAEASRQNKAYQLSLRAKHALEDFRDRRRGQIRNAVENRLNERVGVLLGPTQLIKTVRLDDGFIMTYFNERDQQIARHSISAGMRQLVAMAMLWALKDQAQRPMPVIIDTPLGRIDRENRALLMSEYFPNAGSPLILLPTNSEFGEDGYSAIGHRICRRYEIRNSGGEDAEIVQDTTFKPTAV